MPKTKAAIRLAFSTLLISFIFNTTIAQISCVPVFMKDYSAAGHMEPRAMKALPDGSILIAGRGTSSASGNYQGMISKLANNGTIIWSVLVSSGATGNDEFLGICPLQDGSIIAYGTTTYNHPEGKPWVVHLTSGGTSIWSKMLGSSQNGADRLKAMKQYTDGDLIGTFNTNDSTSSSNPVVFKLDINGSLKWAHTFDNGDNESFTSIAFASNTIYASGFFTAGTRHGVIVKLNSGDGTIIASNHIYCTDDSYQSEITGLEVADNLVTYGLWITSRITSFNYLNALILVKTDLSDAIRFTTYFTQNLDSCLLIPQRTADSGFVILKPLKGTDGTPRLYKVTKYGLGDWSNSLGQAGQSQTNYAMDVTPDGGCATAGFYKSVTAGNVNVMNILKMSQSGSSSGCNYLGNYYVQDTLNSKSKPFVWKTDNTIVMSLDMTLPVTINTFTPKLGKTCESTVCVDKTPLPPGCEKTYRIEYAQDKPSLFQDIITANDGGKISVGQIGYIGLIVRTGINGDVIWSKNYGEFFHQMQFMRIIRTQDNNYIAFAQNNMDLNHGAYRLSSMMKFDDNGNTIWLRDMDYSNFADVAVTPDNGFVMIFNSGYGSGSTNSYVVRYDANATAVWSKQIKHFAATPVYRSLTCSNDAVFLAYDSYNNSNYDNFGVDRLDLATGKQVWSNRYTTGTSDVERMNKIFSINDTSYVFVNNFNPISPSPVILNTILVKLDPNGNKFQSIALQGDSMLSPQMYYSGEASPITVAMTPSFDFVLTGETKVGRDTSLNISRFTREGTKEWSRNFVNKIKYFPYNIHPQANGFILIGSASKPNADNTLFTNSFILKVDSSGSILPSATGACEQMDRSFIPQPINITKSQPAIDSIINFPAYTSYIVNSSTKDVGMDATLFCSLPSSCGTVALKSRGCSMSDTLVYFLKDAVNCDAAATWNFDHNYFKSLWVNGDSIALVPLQKGSSILTVTIEGNCSIEIKNLTAAVGISANQVKLKGDTVICAGQKLKISAGPGYNSYFWNDNSTDSILMVSLPGKYFITVTDQCGNTGADTINIIDAKGAPLHINGITVKCNTDTVLLQATGGYNNYVWSPSINIKTIGNSALVAPTVSTTYHVTAEIFAGCTLSDSVLVTVITSPALSLGNDTSICKGDSLALNAGILFNSYKWNTGDVTSSIIVKNAGTYSVAATFNNGCISKDTMQLISLYNLPVPVLDKDTMFCTGGSKQLDAGTGYEEYLWNDGSKSRYLSVSTIGKYWVMVVDNNGCKGSDTAYIKRLAAAPNNFLPNDTAVCQYDKITITATKMFNSYLWNDMTTSPSITISQPGIYFLQVTDNNNCIGKDTILVSQKQCISLAWIPTAFTPNNDGKNDTFRPLLSGSVLRYELVIFNRWGQKVFETKDTTLGWDGKINGLVAEAGTYVWQCQYQLNGQSEKSEKGTFMLVR